MPRNALHSDDITIEQPSPKPLGPQSDKESEIIPVGQFDKKYAEDLAFLEEPVTIMIDPSPEQNAPGAYPVWVNGKGCERWVNGRWMENAWLEVGVPITIKRKYLGVMIRAKKDTVRTTHTQVRDLEGGGRNNVVERITSPEMSFSIIEDKNPRGAAWVAFERGRRGL